MRIGSRHARLSAAIVAVLYGVSAHANTLVWDPAHTNTAAGSDGSETWSTSAPNWFDTTAGGPTDVPWSNTAPPNSAIIGTGSNAAGSAQEFSVTLGSDITAQNITLNSAPGGSFYSIFDGGAQTLTLNGDIIKASPVGASRFQLTNAINLPTGNHNFVINDSPGDAAPELAMNSAMTGAGSVTLDNTLNASGYPQWGTLAFNVDNAYLGGTTVAAGRLIANTSGALSTGPVTISNAGALAFGGGGTTTGDLTFTNAINITRSDYTSDGHSNYTDAINANNDGSNNTITFNGPFAVNSTDARVAANTNTIVINSNITSTTGGTLTVDGDFAGFVTLNGNNAGLATGGIRIIGGVELNVASQANLGGASAPLIFAGSGTLHPVGGFMTNFGSHVINNTTFSGGIDVDQNQTFSVDQPLGDANNAVGTIGKRGLGTLNLNSTINLRGGQTFWDSGAINVNSAVTLASLHLRSPIVTISSTGSITTTAGFNSFGSDSTGTNGGPDMATVIINGGSLIQTSGDDFNISDNANTTGTITLNSGTLTTGGITFLGKSNGAVGTITQNGGTFTINRNGNFGFDIGDGRNSQTATGNYTLNAGTLTSAGETYVGEGGSGVGHWTQTGGIATINNWFVVGREGATGTVDISGGTLNKAGNSGSNFSVGEGSSNVNTLTVHGTGIINDTAGQLWIGNGGGVGVLNLQDSGSITVNTWFAVGRGGGSFGTVNMTGGTLTQQTADFFTIGSGGTGTVNVSGGTLSAFQTYVGETGGTTGIINISGTAAVSLGTTILANAASVNGTINLNGGTLTAAAFTANNGGGTGIGTFFFNGGTVKPSADAANFIGAKVSSVVSTGGAIIDNNSHTITINSALKHDSSLVSADGGVTVSGTGTITLAGANTYSGLTTQKKGILILNNPAQPPVLTGAGEDLQGGKTIFNYGSSADPANTIRGFLSTSFHGATPFATGQIHSSTAVPNKFGLGYADNTTTQQVTVMYTLYGDSSLDGTVNFTDLLTVAQHYNATNTVWSTGDFNYDGTTNFSDLLALAQHYNQSVPALTASQLSALDASAGALFGTTWAEAQAQVAVPEPGTLGLLGVGAVSLLSRRRRRTNRVTH